MSSPVTGYPQTGSTQNPTSSSSNSTSSLTGSVDPLANEQTFLKLLVSQLQNQDPMNPTDSNQFVSQLTSYSQLEQLINIHKDTTSLVTTLGGSTASSTSSGTGTGASSSGTSSGGSTTGAGGASGSGSGTGSSATPTTTTGG